MSPPQNERAAVGDSAAGNPFKASKAWEFLVPLSLLVVGWSLCFYVLLTLRRDQQQADTDTLQRLVSESERNISRRFSDYTYTLSSAASYLSTSSTVTRAQWNEFANGLDLEVRYPGIRGIGIIFPVSDAAMPDFLKAVRSDGAPQFTPHPLPGTQMPSGEHGIVTFLQPENGNVETLGLDDFSEPNRREAAIEARDLGEPRMTKRLSLVGERDSRANSLLFVPIYRAGSRPRDVQERRANLKAWAFTPFVFRELLPGALSAVENRLRLSLYEGTDDSPDDLLYSSAAPGAKPVNEFRTRLELGGQVYTLEWSRGPAFVPTSISQRVWSAVLGALASVLLAGFVHNLARRRRVLEREVELRTQQLGQSERRFRTYIDQASDILCVHDIEGRIIDANSLASTSLGYSREELVRMNVLDIEVGANRKGAENLWKRAEPGQTVSAEGLYRRKDGAVFPVEVRLSIFDLGGRRYLMALARDITERKRSEDFLRRSEERYRAIIETSMDGFWRLDRQGRILEVNETYCRMTGFTKEELLAMNMGDIARTEPALRQQRLRDIELHGQRRFLAQHRCKDGRSIDVEVSCQFTDTEGGVFVTFLRDITDRLEAESKRQASEERFRQVVENIKEVFWMKDVASERIVYVSPSYEAIWGRSWPESGNVQNIWSGSIHEDDSEAVAKAAVERMMSGDFDEIYRIKRPDGAVRWIHDKAFPVMDSTGRVGRVVGVAEDITDKRDLESKYLRAQRLESVGTLASGIAHDLNNILTPMLMAAGVLGARAMDAKDRELMRLIETSANRGAGIIRQLLTFSRNLHVQRSLVHVDDLIRETAAMVRETFPRGITVITSPNQGLWTINADSTQIHQVLVNLCVNARDAMPEGGVLNIQAENVELADGNVLLAAEMKPGHFVHVSVQDSGQGIPAGVIERIFEPFFTTKEIGKGSGLGLSSALGIVRNHGGALTVESTLGRGTTFHVYLPAVQVTASGPHTDPVPPENGDGQSILLVDDEEAVLTAMAHLLDEHGYKVLTAHNGKEALATFVANRSQVRLVVTDMMMPVMDGRTFARLLHVMDPMMKVIASSGLEGERVKEFGIVEFLAKPYQPVELLAALARHLANRER